MLIRSQQTTHLSAPGDGSLRNPLALVVAEFASIFIASLFVVFPLRRINSAYLPELHVQRVDIVAVLSYLVRYDFAAAGKWGNS